MQRPPIGQIVLLLPRSGCGSGNILLPLPEHGCETRRILLPRRVSSFWADADLAGHQFHQARFQLDKKTKRRPSCHQGAASRFASVSEVVRFSPLPSCHWLQRLLRRNDNPAKLAYWKSLDIGSPPFDLLNTSSIWGDLPCLARANHSRASPVSCARPISCSGGSRSGHRRRLDQPVSKCRPARRNRLRRSCAGCGA